MGRRALPLPTSILISGATGAIGSALAQAYAGPGRSMILQGRNTAALDAITRECEQRGAEVHGERVDLADAHSLQDWLERLQRQAPPDLAIVNAGVTSHTADPSGGEQWTAVKAVLDVNLTAAVALTEALLPGMRRRGSGQIALISSLSAYFGLPLTPSYCASKAGLKAYGEALRGWLDPQGVAVNVVLPGFVASAMSERFPGPKPFTLSPQRAAAVIRRGLMRNKARIAFPAPLSWGMWWLAVLPPDAALWLLRRLGYGGGQPAVR
jgi:short-subunit dehydrogenase